MRTILRTSESSAATAMYRHRYKCSFLQLVLKKKTTHGVHSGAAASRAMTLTAAPPHIHPFQVGPFAAPPRLHVCIIFVSLLYRNEFRLQAHTRSNVALPLLCHWHVELVLRRAVPLSRELLGSKLEESACARSNRRGLPRTTQPTLDELSSTQGVACGGTTIH